MRIILLNTALLNFMELPTDLAKKICRTSGDYISCLPDPNKLCSNISACIAIIAGVISLLPLRSRIATSLPPRNPRRQRGPIEDNPRIQKGATEGKRQRSQVFFRAVTKPENLVTF
jgi:hypothetical protein